MYIDIYMVSFGKSNNISSVLTNKYIEIIYFLLIYLKNFNEANVRRFQNNFAENQMTFCLYFYNKIFNPNLKIYHSII